MEETFISPAPKPPVTELEKLWQEYLQACCEVGQLNFALDQLDGQQRQIEKSLELANKKVKSASAKHKEEYQKSLPQDKTQILNQQASPH